MKKFILHLFSGLLITHLSMSQSPKAATGLTFEPSTYEGLRWRELGPFRGGRSCTVTGVKDNPNLYYMGTVGGGVWRTVDGGQTWGNITDTYFGGTIGAVAVAESDPNVIYVGEGEQTLRNNVASGTGMWRSTDAGASWKRIGLADSRHIARIRIHPKNPDVVYVAAMGNLWKPNDMRGIFRSTDGGQTWKKVLYINDQAGAADLVLDPNNPRIMYASTWNMKRNGYRMDSGGPDSKLWKSTDGGDTWENLSDKTGMPAGTNGIIGVTVSPKNSNRVWAIIENKESGGIYRSDDAGKTWARINQDRALLQRAWYYCRIYADPQNEDMVYVMNVSYGISKDGGKTFELKDAPHGDHHDLWIDPANNRRMAIADDGGAQVSTDGGNNWTTYHNQPTAQFYRVATDNHFPYRIYGAQQDNTSVRISHRTGSAAVTEKDWVALAIGESAHLAPDPLNSEVVFGGDYKGYMTMQDLGTGQERSTNVYPDLPAGSGVEQMKYRFNWNYPVFFSPHNPKKLYAGSNHLHVSYTGGESWEVISPDLSRGEPETIKSSGGPITQDNTGAEYYANVFAATESPYTEGEIWTGSDDGLVHVTTDGGKNWKNITPPMSPKFNMINAIDVNPFVKGGAYISATSYKFGDYTPYIYKTLDYGKTWTVPTKGIPKDEFVRVVRADPKRKGLLYAGTEKGVWVSFDDGENWSKLQLNLPPVPIHDLAIKNDNLIAATHGRSFWLIDDLTPLHQLNKEIASKEVILYQPMPSYRMAGSNKRNAQLEGENHPNGVLIHYFIKKAEPATEVKLDILTGDGRVIRALSNKAKEKADQLMVKSGGGRFVWDMRYPGYKTFPGMVFYGSPNLGPKAVPGKYQVRLTVNGQSQTQPFDILKDPRLKTTPDDFQAQFDFLMKVRDKVTEANEGIINLRKIRDDLTYLKNKMGTDEKNKDLNEAIKKFEDELKTIENDIHQTKNSSVQDPLNYGIKLNNRLAHLMTEQAQGDYRPTKQGEEVRSKLTQAIDEELGKLKISIESNLLRINQMAKDKGVVLVN
ncbi:VPS10 domain-containing protein [Spirosoma radiotolerans]|uniref:Glycosyl hydrolase n=1 Tax=Spirosoma radiotolerans TaxID=1379870 RepID=A0A0E3V4V0_9BACT|nr:glycosyl hydrolase [Spirosoma radiotolerans]AKD53637.1 glycosyl hydrolase [Spirosoma radiotolerans]